MAVDHNLNSDKVRKLVVAFLSLGEQAVTAERVGSLMPTSRALVAEIEYARNRAAHHLQVFLKEAFVPASTYG